MITNRIVHSTATLSRRTGVQQLAYVQAHHRSQYLHTTSRLSVPDDKTQWKSPSASPKDTKDTLDQGHSASRQGQPPHAQVQSEHVQSGQKLKEESERDGGTGQGDANPVDAATAGKGIPSAGRDNNNDPGSNPENVGMKEQVGSASTTHPSSSSPSAHKNEGSQEEATPPSFLSAVKSALGMGTSSGEVKQNRGGGAGVTGTGTMPHSKAQGNRPGAGASGGSVEYGRKRAYHSAAGVGLGGAGVGGEVKEEHERVVRVVKDANGKGSTPKEEVVEAHSTTIRRAQVQSLSSLLTPNPTSALPPGRSASTTSKQNEQLRAHEPYRNVGSERPYEPPAEDASVGAKQEVREKGLRYGGVDGERMARETGMGGIGP